MASMLPALRQAAPRLTKRLFECSQRRSSTLQEHVSNLRPLSTVHISRKVTRPFKLGVRPISYAVESSGAPNPKLSFPSSAVGKSSLRHGNATRARFFPRTSEKVVAYWLLGSAASVFGIVVFGGLTRLTESG